MAKIKLDMKHLCRHVPSSRTRSLTVQILLKVTHFSKTCGCSNAGVTGPIYFKFKTGAIFLTQFQELDSVCSLLHTAGRTGRRVCTVSLKVSFVTGGDNRLYSTWGQH